MWRVQVLLLAALLSGAEVGEAGLAALATQRSAIQCVEGTGIRTVQRVDDAEAPATSTQVRFAIAADGRYEIVLTDPDDPDGERTRFVSDGRRAASQERMYAGDPEVVKNLGTDGQDLLQRLLSCLRLDLARMRAEYAIELRPAEAGLRELHLVPTDATVLREVVSIGVWLDDAGRPVRVVLDDTSGNRNRLQVTSFADDPVIDPARFVVPQLAAQQP
jgi:outer membrane lipoprotein-sorting protein